MKFTLSWLREHLDTDASVAAIADKLTPPGSSGRQGAAARRDWLESLFSARFTCFHVCKA